MEISIEDENRFRHYLLGDLSSEEEEIVETLYWDNDEYIRILDIVEDDLVENYLRGELPPRERQLFERRLKLSSRSRSTLEWTRAYIGAPKSATPAKDDVFQTMFSQILSALTKGRFDEALYLCADFLRRFPGEARCVQACRKEKKSRAKYLLRGFISIHSLLPEKRAYRFSRLARPSRVPCQSIAKDFLRIVSIGIPFPKVSTRN